MVMLGEGEEWEGFLKSVEDDGGVNVLSRLLARGGLEQRTG